GIPLGAQSVLLAGINDTPAIMMDLVHTLVRNRIRPYYLYQCDLVEGAGHFRTPVSVGIEIMEALRGHTSGYAVPTYVVDAPGGGGKIPVGPTYLISQGANKVVLRNYEGYITTYDEPVDYIPVAHRRHETHDERNRQAGVAGLLDGTLRAIKPEGFDTLHERHQRLTKVRWGPIQEGVHGETDPVTG
ncbi:MAG: lysine 2,3-aminomutase, partial [Ardenticatenaceae bacterium]